MHEAFSPNDGHNVLLATAVDGVVNFSNAMVNTLTPGTQHELNKAIAGGAKVELTIQIVPSVEVRGTVAHNGQILELFAVSFPFQPSELLN